MSSIGVITPVNDSDISLGFELESKEKFRKEEILEIETKPLNQKQHHKPDTILSEISLIENQEESYEFAPTALNSFTQTKDMADDQEL